MEDCEAPLLLAEEKGTRRLCSVPIWAEMNRVSSIAFPMVVVTVSQYLLRISPLFMLGHLGELSLSGASVTTSIANVTGYSIIFGMASALETLCGQAYGAQQHQRVGTYTLTGIICLLLVALPISIMWIYIDKLLIFVGQDPLISIEAGKYAMWLIPSLFPYAIYQALVRYLQIQSMIFPMLLSTVVTLCFHLPLCWAFIFRLELGSAGAALSIGISYWFNAIILGLYVVYSPSCKKTHPTSFSREVFLTIRQFLSLAIPAALMICLAWWSYEIIVLLSGLLSNPQLETSVSSICFTTMSLHYHIPDSFGAAASTRISNELGARRPKAAQTAFYTVLVVSVAECIAASAVVLSCRHVLGYAYSNEYEVIAYVNQISPLLSLCIIMDGFETALSGIVRGSGWQHIAVYVNIGSYYLIGIPVALVAGFVLHLRGEGLWCGLVVGSTLKSLSLLIITSRTDWEIQAIEARERISQGTSETTDELIFNEHDTLQLK
ncbi:protein DETOXIFICATION 14-like isoform X1 [Andrographis paniculata]|nr:protein DETOXIFICATION 14-like isoform X1 [Andrographis paniculata]